MKDTMEHKLGDEKNHGDHLETAVHSDADVRKPKRTRLPHSNSESS